MSKVVNKTHPFYTRNSSRSFTNVECPYCSSDLAYVYWLEFETVGHCPDCGEDWTEGTGGIWQL